MTKTEWLKLADAYVKEANYWYSLYSAKMKIAKKCGIGPDFLGTDYFDGPMTSVAEELLGGDFCHWCFDCNQNFKKFNEGVSLEDGSHPNVKSLGDIYDFWKGVNNED